jgi:heat shock protein HslJ
MFIIDVAKLLIAGGIKRIKMKHIMKQGITLLVLALSLTACHTSKKTAVATTDNKTRQAELRLSGTWELTYISGISTEFDQFYKGKKPVITFDVTQHKVSGNTSCNSFSGPFTAQSSNINLKGPMMMTKMFCEGGGEAAFLEALQKVTGFSADGTTLDLIAGDIGVMQFRRK